MQTKLHLVALRNDFVKKIELSMEVHDLVKFIFHHFDPREGNYYDYTIDDFSNYMLAANLTHVKVIGWFGISLEAFELSDHN